MLIKRCGYCQFGHKSWTDGTLQADEFLKICVYRHMCLCYHTASMFLCVCVEESDETAVPRASLKKNEYK